MAVINTPGSSYGAGTFPVANGGLKSNVIQTLQDLLASGPAAPVAPDRPGTPSGANPLVIAANLLSESQNFHADPRNTSTSILPRQYVSPDQYQNTDAWKSMSDPTSDYYRNYAARAGQSADALAAHDRMVYEKQMGDVYSPQYTDDARIWANQLIKDHPDNGMNVNDYLSQFGVAAPSITSLDDPDKTLSQVKGYADTYNSNLGTFNSARDQLSKSLGIDPNSATRQLESYLNFNSGIPQLGSAASDPNAPIDGGGSPSQYTATFQKAGLDMGALDALKGWDPASTATFGNLYNDWQNYNKPMADWQSKMDGYSKDLSDWQAKQDQTKASFLDKQNIGQQAYDKYMGGAGTKGGVLPSTYSDPFSNQIGATDPTATSQYWQGQKSASPDPWANLSMFGSLSGGNGWGGPWGRSNPYGAS